LHFIRSIDDANSYDNPEGGARTLLDPKDVFSSYAHTEEWLFAARFSPNQKIFVKYEWESSVARDNFG